MNDTQCRAVMDRLANMWPNHRMSAETEGLWIDTLASMDYDAVLDAIHEFQRGPLSSGGPDIDGILGLAASKPDDADDRRAEYAREAEACRQDHEANRRFLDEQDAETLATAKAWLARQPFTTGLIRSAEKGKGRMAAAFLVLAIRHRLWERGPKWWNYLKSQEVAR